MVREHRQERYPRPHLVAVLLGHDAGDLGDVPEIVHHPAREQLAQRDPAEARVVPGKVELAGAETPRAKQLEVGGAQPGELGQQRLQRAARVAAPVPEAIVGLEARIILAREGPSRSPRRR